MQKRGLCNSIEKVMVLVDELYQSCLTAECNVTFYDKILIYILMCINVSYQKPKCDDKSWYASLKTLWAVFLSHTTVTVSKRHFLNFKLSISAFLFEGDVCVCQCVGFCFRACVFQCFERTLSFLFFSILLTSTKHLLCASEVILEMIKKYESTSNRRSVTRPSQLPAVHEEKEVHSTALWRRHASTASLMSLNSIEAPPLPNLLE